MKFLYQPWNSQYCNCIQGDAEQFWSANLRIRPGPRGDRPTCIPLRLYVVHPAEGVLRLYFCKKRALRGASQASPIQLL